MKRVVHISNWKLVAAGKRPAHVTAENWPRCLRGWVSDHPDLGAGEITTSAVVDIDVENHRAETKNTIYILGAPDPDWFASIKDKGELIPEQTTVHKKFSN